MIIHDIKQNTPEWLAVRRGKVTASEVDSLISPLGKIRVGKGVDSYTYRKVCEKLLGFYGTGEQGGSWATEQGAVLENEAVHCYSFSKDIDVKRVGFCSTDDARAGCSPDGLCGEDGGVEVKCFQPEHALRCFVENEVPEEYRMQIQMSLWVTNRAWWDFFCYSRQFPSLCIRVIPDHEIQKSIGTAIHAFYERFDAVYSKITAIRDAENAAKEAAYHAANP